MNKRQVIILWVIAIVLGIAVAAVKLSQNQTTVSATSRAQGQTIFESFPATDAATIEIQGATSTVTLLKKDAKWVVAERGNYPANSSYVNDFIRTLGELKITLGLEAGPSFAPRFGMDEGSTNPAERGLTATFKDSSGKELAKISLGKNIESGASQSPMGMGGAVGRYIRNHADSSGFYAISEMFPSVSTEAKRWLNDDFINPEKIKSITVSEVGKDTPAWKLIRDTEEAKYKLEGAAATEVLDTATVAPLESIFSLARFEDIVPADRVAERAGEGKRTVTLETFEGFRYTITITPTKPTPVPAAPSAEATPADNQLLTVNVTAELPKERKKEEGEKPEDAKTKDSAFTDRLKNLTDKLAKEKAFAGITFEIPRTMVEPLLKDRATLITKAAPPTADAEGAPVQSLPGGLIASPPNTATTGPIEAVTPALSAPAEEEEEAVEEESADEPKE